MTGVFENQAPHYRGGHCLVIDILANTLALVIGNQKTRDTVWVELAREKDDDYGYAREVVVEKITREDFEKAVTYFWGLTGDV